MNYEELAASVQAHFTDGLVVVVGSGLSAAEGIPGMRELERYLSEEAASLAESTQTEWKPIAEALRSGEGLESALLKHQPSETLEAWIAERTCQLLLPAERQIMSSVLSGVTTLRITKLLNRLLKPKNGLAILTTNYDRLVELGCEMAGMHVDTMATGHYAGAFDHEKSMMGSCKSLSVQGRTPVLEYFPRAIGHQMRVLGLALAALFAFGPLRLPAQTSSYVYRADVIRGQVVAESGKPIMGAAIAITAAPDRRTLRASTDSGGAFTVDIPSGSDDYLFHVSAVGFQSFRRRLQRSAADSLFTVAVRLKASTQRLATVQVTARAFTPARDDYSATAGVGASETYTEGVRSGIALQDRGSLQEISALTAGATRTPGGGVTVLGVPSSQNSATLNGMPFAAGGFPRSAQMLSSVATSTYDATRGGFSGLQTQLLLAPGGALTFREASLTIDSRWFQYTDVNRPGSAGGSQP